MKKILVVIVILFSVNIASAAFIVSKPIENPVVETKAQKERAIMEMVTKMSVKDYEVFTGKKMNFVERLGFKITKKRFEKKLAMAESTSTGFNIGGFALGFFLGLIGVLIAYLFIQDANLRKWSWIGLGAVLVIVLLSTAVF